MQISTLDNINLPSGINQMLPQKRELIISPPTQLFTLPHLQKVINK